MRAAQVLNILLVISYKPDGILVSGNVLYFISYSVIGIIFMLREFPR